MSAQQRYSTLVKHICQIYSAKDDGVKELTTGLRDILSCVNPGTAADWKKVQIDSKRLLRVWHSCADDDDDAADEVVDQIAESLKEFVASEVQVIADKPTLEVMEVAPAPVFKTVVIETTDEEEEEEEEEALVVLKKSVATDDEESVIEPDDDEDNDGIKMLVEEADMNVDDVVDDDESGGGTAMDIEDGTPDEEAEAEAEAEAAAAVEEAKEKEEADKDAEAEESGEEAEEEGLEVEKRVIRGRPYWVDVNTNKLYAVISDDDVGDEVGAIINGKPVFRS